LIVILLITLLSNTYTTIHLSLALIMWGSHMGSCSL